MDGSFGNNQGSRGNRGDPRDRGDGGRNKLMNEIMSEMELGKNMPDSGASPIMQYGGNDMSDPRMMMMHGGQGGMGGMGGMGGQGPDMVGPMGSRSNLDGPQGAPNPIMGGSPMPMGSPMQGGNPYITAYQGPDGLPGSEPTMVYVPEDQEEEYEDDDHPDDDDEDERHEDRGIGLRQVGAAISEKSSTFDSLLESGKEPLIGAIILGLLLLPQFSAVFNQFMPKMITENIYFGILAKAIIFFVIFYLVQQFF